MFRINLSLFLAMLVLACHKQEVASTQPSSSPFLTTPAPPIKHEWGDARFDVCALLTRAEVAETVGVAINETKSAGGPDNSLFISQCFYMTANMDVSAVMSVIENDPNAAGRRTPNDLWKEMFGEQKEQEFDRKEEEAEEAERRKRFPPERVTGLDCDAYWANGALYALKGNKILRLAVSGENSKSHLTNAKALAIKALGRLQAE